MDTITGRARLRMSFRIDEKRHARDIRLLRLAGDLDARAVRELTRRLRTDDERRAIVVDFTGVRSIEPIMLSWLVTTVISLRPGDDRLAVLCPDPAKRQIFELMGLDRVFPVETSLDGALRELRRPGTKSERGH